MFKRIILCSVVFCLLLVLLSCGLSGDTLNTLNSISNAFLNVHYSATVSEANDYGKLLSDIENKHQNPPSSPGLYNDTEFSERLENLVKDKYQAQPLTDKCLEKIILLPVSPAALWKMVLKTGSDIKVTSVKTSLRSTDIDEKENDIDYTVDLVINKASYKVTGALVLTLVDGKWQINDIYEFGWSPFPMELLTNN